MKCQDFELQVRELVGRRASTRDSALIEHAGSCAACGRRLEEERRLENRLSGLADHFHDLAPGLQLREKIRQRCLQEIQARGVQQAETIRPDRIPHWLLAAAAVLLTVAAGVLYVATSGFPGSSGTRGPEIAQGERRVADPAGIRPADAVPASEQMYSEFIPIGNCRSLDCLDRARLMRIDMPRSSVAYFGIPKTRIRSRGDRIAADVLVGDDGIARAIRFVY